MFEWHLGFHRDQVLDKVVCGRSNAWNVHDILNAFKWSIRDPVIHDALCGSFADPWERIQLFHSGGIYIYASKINVTAPAYAGHIDLLSILHGRCQVHQFRLGVD